MVSSISIRSTFSTKRQKEPPQRPTCWYKRFLETDCVAHRDQIQIRLSLDKTIESTFVVQKIQQNMLLRTERSLNKIVEDFKKIFVI